MVEKKLFGTDGIRGKANVFPIKPEIALKVGQALGFLLQKNSSKSKRTTVLIGKDTRLSCYMLEQALASGLNSMGVWVQLTGPLPSPLVLDCLAQNMRVSAGVIISASHNLYQDNGIKIFGKSGFKISSEMEKQIEELVFSDSLPVSSEVGRTRRIDDAAGRYIVYVKRTFPEKLSLEGLRLVLDCAHGAGYKTAPAIFEELGAEVIVMSNKPDGYNINADCGAVFPEKMQKAVLDLKAHAGVSLDGDADRVVMADEKGRLLSGDHILGALASRLKKEKPVRQVVSTQMAGRGLENYLNKHNIKLVRTDVGDRNIMNSMISEGIELGGEPSGHIIFAKHSYRGDACIAALNVLAAMVSENQKLSALRDEMVEVPQVLKQVPVKKKTPFHLLPGYDSLTADVSQRLKNKGRFYIRFSGTEPLARVMVEGESEPLIQKCAEDISQFLGRHLNPMENQ